MSHYLPRAIIVISDHLLCTPRLHIFLEASCNVIVLNDCFSFYVRCHLCVSSHLSPLFRFIKLLPARSFTLCTRYYTTSYIYIVLSHVYHSLDTVLIIFFWRYNSCVSVSCPRLSMHQYLSFVPFAFPYAWLSSTH